MRKPKLKLGINIASIFVLVGIVAKSEVWQANPLHVVVEVAAKNEVW